MAGACKPGPLGQNPKVRDLNDGTMICGLSPRPGVNGVTSSSAINIHSNRSNNVLAAPPLRKQSSAVALQVLRQGTRGSEVQKLQQQLNVRLMPPPQLAIDGTFGPLTNQAVLQYQKGVSITPDGIVGKQTWYHLLRGDKVATSQTQAITPKTPSAAIQPSNNISKNSPVISPKNEIVLPAPAIGIWEWPMQDKFAEALRLTAPKLPASMRHEFEALLNPTNLGIIGGTLVFWAGSHAFGVGIVADIVLLIGGVFFLGMAIYDVAEELGSFLVTTSTAADTKDLDKAASHLARAIAIIGVAAFIALIAKVAKGRVRKGIAAEAPSKSLIESQPSQKVIQPETSNSPRLTLRKPAKLDESITKYARSSEQSTAKRLADDHPKFDERTFKAPPPPDPGYDWVDDLGRKYDAMGDGTKSQYFRLDQFTRSIDNHLLKGNDFTVIDMTGYKADQIAAVKQYLDALPAAKQLMIIKVGFY